MTIMQMPRAMPGRMPPMNREPIDASVQEAYVIMMVLGGMMVPSRPATAMVARENFLE